MAKKSVKRTAKKSGASEVDARRAALEKWFELHDTNANEAAKRAEFSVSAIYNFLNGDTKSLSSKVLSKLASAYNSSVDAILNGSANVDNTRARVVRVVFRVGARGSMFVCDDENLVASPPAGVALPNGVSAAVIDGDGLLPIPDGWTVFFRDETAAPNTLVGKLAVVRYSGGGDRPVVRNIQTSKFEGLHTLRAMDGTVTEDVQIVAAHEIVAFGQSKISGS